MALLQGKDGRRFEITLDGYEYPELPQDEWDANWLKVTVEVVDGPKRWKRSDPAALTWEICTLVTWLRSVKLNPREADCQLVFTEPCLVFLLEGEKQDRFVIELDYNLSSTGEHVEGSDCLDFALDRLDLDALAAGLEKELKRFPIRVLDARGMAIRHINGHGCVPGRP